MTIQSKFINIFEGIMCGNDRESKLMKLIIGGVNEEILNDSH